MTTVVGALQAVPRIEACGDQTGAVTLTDGTSILTRDEFCALLALTRCACPA